MPDRRKHRGPHPDDGSLFAPAMLRALRRAVADYSWLLTRGYATDSSLKLVGDRYNLRARQRMAVRRSGCSDAAMRDRASRSVEAAAVANGRIGIDGYNLLITVESALSEGVILIGRDGACRDLASIHGTYRHVEETIPALRLIAEHLDSLRPARVDWYLDRPVSNSGRLRARMIELLDEPVAGGRTHPALSRLSKAGRRGAPIRDSWNVELVHSPDTVLSSYGGIVATSDSAVLDRCGPWFNLGGELIERITSQPWVVDLRDAVVDE